MKTKTLKDKDRPFAVIQFTFDSSALFHRFMFIGQFDTTAGNPNEYAYQEVAQNSRPKPQRKDATRSRNRSNF